MVYELCGQDVLTKGTKRGRILSWFFLLSVICGPVKLFLVCMEQKDTMISTSYPRTIDILLLFEYNKKQQAGNLP